MALLIVTGGSGSGKSTWVCEHILRESEKNPKKNYFVIVPDQFTMQTQMDFVNRSPRGGIMNIDILSFSRLAHRIFEETGGNRRPVLDDTGKSLILRRIAGSIKEQVPVIGSNLNKQGYIHEVKSAISEFMQYGIGEKELDEMLSFCESRGALYHKLKDIKVLYRAFREYIKEHYITTEESMDILAKELPKSARIPGSVVVFDGFTGFTPIQENVIGVLLELCEQVIVTVTMEQENKSPAPVKEQDLFSFADKTVNRLKKLASERRIEILPEKTMPEIRRFTGKPELAFLESHLFRYPIVPYRGEKENRIRISFHKDMQQEVRFLCRQIRSLIKKTGCAYRDIAVIAGDLSSYESCIEDEFEQYELPLFMDKTRKIELNPFVELIKSSLDILTDNFSYESVFRYLRSGLVDFTPEETDDLENYVLEMGIQGKKAWAHAFAGRTKLMKQKEDAIEKLQYLNTLRERLSEQLSSLLYGNEKSDSTYSGQYTVKELVRRLYDFTLQNKTEEKLLQYAFFFEQKKEYARAKEYRQIYRLIMELLEQITELIGEEKMTVREFADILDAGFNEIEVGTIPKSVDRIIVGDIERTRLKQVKYLFFLGVNDGYIPGKTNKGGIISDIDREFLKGSNMELAPSPRDKMYIQKYYLYLNLTKPSEGLFLSYAGTDAQGAALRPSYLVALLKKLFWGCEYSYSNEQEQMQIGNLSEAKELYCMLLSKYAEGTISKEERECFENLLLLLGKEKSDKLLLMHWIENTWYTKKDEQISQAAAALLYGDTILSSISRMEKYASCAYSFFLQYGLSLRERELYGFEAKDIGTVFHGVLECFSQKLKENHYTWFDFPEAEGRMLVTEAMQEVCLHYTDAILFENAWNRYTMGRMEEILQKCVRNISYQIRKGRFMPKEYEVSFQLIENLQDMDVTFTDKDRMKLSGRIDRLDVCEKENKVYVKIVDYKSGDKNFDLVSFYHGTQLQLVVYMNEALRRSMSEYPDKEAVSAAMLYYHVDDPIVEGTSGITPEAVNQKVREALRMKGIINSDGDILEALDTSKTAKSDCVSLDYDSKGGLKASVNAFDNEQMKLLSDYASYCLKTMGVKIKKGEIPLNPYKSSTADSCEYCCYKDVCGFDEKLPGHRKRDLKKEKDTDYLKLIKEKLT